MEPKAFYTREIVAGVLNMHEVTVRGCCVKGRFPAAKVRRQWRVSHAALEEMLGQRIALENIPWLEPRPCKRWTRLHLQSPTSSPGRDARE